MSNVNSPAPATGIDIASIVLDTSTSIQFKFAALQLCLAQSNKEKAEKYMETISSNQTKAKECASMIAQARALQNAVQNGGRNTMPSDMKAYFNEHGLNYDHDGNDDLHYKSQWEYNIKSLTNYQESLGTDTQQLMVYIQDFMGQYNSYLTGSSTTIQQANQTLGTVNRGQ